MAKLTVYHAIFIPQRVTIPERCPKCEVSFRCEGNLCEWNLMPGWTFWSTPKAQTEKAAQREADRLNRKMGLTDKLEAAKIVASTMRTGVRDPLKED